MSGPCRCVFSHRTEEPEGALPLAEARDLRAEGKGQVDPARVKEEWNTRSCQPSFDAERGWYVRTIAKG